LKPQSLITNLMSHLKLKSAQINDLKSCNRRSCPM
jgi:hypothetical protein